VQVSGAGGAVVTGRWGAVAGRYGALLAVCQPLGEGRDRARILRREVAAVDPQRDG
jgi:hypothetical protein